MRSIRRGLIPLVALAFVLVACFPMPIPASPEPTLPIPTVEEATATPVPPSPTTEVPTATPIPPSPTPIAPTATPSCSPLDPQFQPVHDWAGSLSGQPYVPVLGCPQGPAYTINGAIQEFRTPILGPAPRIYMNYMIWLEDTRTIYVVVKYDRYTGSSELYTYPDTWDESQPLVPPACAGMVAEQDYVPPADPAKSLQIPIRGFGKVWCENQWWERIGYGLGAERGVTLTIQRAQGGLYIAVPSAYGAPPAFPNTNFMLDTDHGSAIHL